MTLNEAKEQIAVSMGYKDWEQCINDQPNYMVEQICDKAADIYVSKVKWSFEESLKVIKAQTKIIADQTESIDNLHHIREFLNLDVSVRDELIAAYEELMKIDSEIYFSLIDQLKPKTPTFPSSALTRSLVESKIISAKAKIK